MKKLYISMFILSIIFISNSVAKHCTYDINEKSLCESECKDKCVEAFNGQTYTCNKC